MNTDMSMFMNTHIRIRPDTLFMPETVIITNKNPLYRCMMEWNRLPAYISQVDSKDMFKKLIKDTIVNLFEKVL